MIPPSPQELQAEIGEIIFAHGTYHYNQGEPECDNDENTMLKIVAICEREKKAAVEEAIPKAMKIVFNDPNILVAEGVDIDACGKHMARKLYAELFPDKP